MSLIRSTGHAQADMTNSRTVAQVQNIVVEENNWINRELREGAFQDARLLRRLRALLGQFAQTPGQGNALVGQDWANTKAAYRFLSNARFSESVDAYIESLPADSRDLASAIAAKHGDYFSPDQRASADFETELDD